MTQVPEKMTDANWLSSLQMDSKSKRSRYYAYLRKIELKQKSRQKKKEVKQQQRAEVAEETEEARAGPKNTIFMMVYDSIMKKVSYTSWHGQCVCIFCGMSLCVVCVCVCMCTFAHVYVRVYMCVCVCELVVIFVWL